MEINVFVELAAEYLRKQEFTVKNTFADKVLNKNVAFYMAKKGKSMMGLMPYEDHFFIHEISGSDTTKETIVKLHERAREFVNSQIKTPKAFRMKVPNIVSVFFTEKGFDKELISYVKSNTSTIMGGEAHSMFLINVKDRSIVSQGLKETYVVGTAGLVHLKLKKTDPINRAYHYVNTMSTEIFREELTAI